MFVCACVLEKALGGEGGGVETARTGSDARDCPCCCRCPLPFPPATPHRRQGQLGGAQPAVRARPHRRRPRAPAPLRRPAAGVCVWGGEGGGGGGRWRTSVPVAEARCRFTCFLTLTACHYRHCCCCCLPPSHLLPPPLALPPPPPLLQFFEREGCHMVEMSCEEHDQLAASTQFITHTVGRMLGAMQVRVRACAGTRPPCPRSVSCVAPALPSPSTFPHPRYMLCLPPPRPVLRPAAAASHAHRHARLPEPAEPGGQHRQRLVRPLLRPLHVQRQLHAAAGAPGEGV